MMGHHKNMLSWPVIMSTNYSQSLSLRKNYSNGAYSGIFVECRRRKYHIVAVCVTTHVSTNNTGPKAIDPLTMVYI